MLFSSRLFVHGICWFWGFFLFVSLFVSAFNLPGEQTSCPRPLPSSPKAPPAPTASLLPAAAEVSDETRTCFLENWQIDKLSLSSPSLKEIYTSRPWSRPAFHREHTCADCQPPGTCAEELWWRPDQFSIDTHSSKVNWKTCVVVWLVMCRALSVPGGR